MLTRHTYAPQPAERRKEDRSGDKRVGCYLNRHEPHRRQANWNGETYVSRCEHCAKPIRRVSHGKWVLDYKAEAWL